MCQKTNTLKHFFVLLNHPFPLQRPLVVGVVRNTPETREIYERTKTSLFLSPKQIQELGLKIPSQPPSYLVPIQIPRDWFIH